LGPEGFGQFSYALALVGLFAAIAGMGLPGIVVRELVRTPRNAAATMGSAFLLQFMGGVVGAALAFGTASYLRAGDYQTLLLVLLIGCTLVFKAADVVRYWFEAHVCSRYVVWVDSVIALMSAGTIAIFILSEAPLVAFGSIKLAESVLLAAGLLWVYHLMQMGERWNVSWTRSRTLLGDSWPLIFTGLLTAINLKIDQIMIAELAGMESNGRYAVASAIPQLVISTLILAEKSFYPANIRAGGKGVVQLRQNIARAYTFIFLLSLLAWVFLLFFAHGLVVLLYGERYENAVYPLQILLTLLPLSALVRTQAQYYQIIGQTKFIFYRQALIAACNILLNWFLIPVYGIAGAAYAIVVSFSIGFLVSLILDRDFAEIPKLIVLNSYGLLRSGRLQ
jgi:O-antigen/teichoic acid export membrane protein